MPTLVYQVPLLLTLATCSSVADDKPSTSIRVLSANATLERVVDGDTIDVEVDGVEERVRLIGIDTPETKKPDTPVECFGPEATAFTESLLPRGTALYLERDVEARDSFGRLLAYVYVADSGTFANLEIVRQGYAQPLTIPPNVAHSTEFVEAARAAERADVGLWARCSG
jgi:micrococcal nuclease